MSRKERESRTPAQVAEQPNPGADDSPPQRFGMPTPDEVLAEKVGAAAPNPMPSPFLLPEALNRVRALLWRAAIELGQGHPARKHIEGLGDAPPHTLECPNGHILASITATLRMMHAAESVLRPLDEAADILAGRR